MSITSDQLEGHVGFDSNDHRSSYIFVPGGGIDHNSHRPHKRRKVSKQKLGTDAVEEPDAYHFPILLDNREGSQCVETRKKLFEDSWGWTEGQIQKILRDANEVTLREVAAFVHESMDLRDDDRIPTGLIVTGPNIASQDLIFGQLSNDFRSTNDVIVVNLRSGDAPNLKTALKKLVRESTSQTIEDDENTRTISQEDGQKLLNYDLESLQNHIASHGSRAVVVAFQDSEAFDTGLLTEIIILFSSWFDRIPFIVLFGVATSVEMFHERLPSAAIRRLHGAKFDVEQISETLEKIFQKVITGQNVPLRFGPGLVGSLLQRQTEHVQSLQSFISSLKYTYMCHFYANPLSILLAKQELGNRSDLLQAEHFEAIRMLPSFRKRIESLLDQNETTKARFLLESNEHLLQEIELFLPTGNTDGPVSTKAVDVLRSLRLLLLVAASANVDCLRATELYIMALSGTINDSTVVLDVLSAIKHMKAGDVLDCIGAIINMIEAGDPYGDLEGWSEEAADLSNSLQELEAKLRGLDWQSDTLHSKYTLQKKSIRATVIAQKVQLSKAEATLSHEDLAFTEIVDDFLELLRFAFSFENPQDEFLSEIWLYDSRSPIREVFTPKPRYALERAVSDPHDYLGCSCCASSSGSLSASQPPTAIIYQLYLETSGLINVFDLWSAFFAVIGGEDGEDCDERLALSLFYRGLSDLKYMGMVKQSRKKTDHLGKLAWKGL